MKEGLTKKIWDKNIAALCLVLQMGEVQSQLMSINWDFDHIDNNWPQLTF